MESIIAATALGGELLLHPHELGKVAPGYYADLLLVNGNPLEDITLLSHHENLDVILIVRVFFFSFVLLLLRVLLTCLSLVPLPPTQNGRLHKQHDKDHPSYYENKGSMAK